MDNIDYGTRAALISAALKRAREEQDTPIPQMRTVGGFAVGPTGGDIFNMGIRQALGGYSANKREQELTALNDEQMAKFADLSKQLTTPGTKTLKRTLEMMGPTESGAALAPATVEEQVPLDYSNPADLSADNARRMGLAAQMAQLSIPQAKQVSQDYLSKGASFPDTLAQLQMRQLETGQQNAMRLQEAARLEREREEGRNQRAQDAAALRMTLKAMNSGGGGPRDRFSVQMGPDNQMYRVNLESGVATPITIGGAVPEGATGGAPGAGLVRPGTDKALTEVQGKAVMFGTRAAQAHNILDEVGANYKPVVVATMHGAESIPGANMAVNAAAGPNEQKVAQAQRNFINAVLRQESGAAINQSEFNNARIQYFPQPGDKPEVIAQKKANRELAIQGFGTIAGPKGGKAVATERANKPQPTGPYTDAAKEQRYQEWKRSQQ